MIRRKAALHVAVALLYCMASLSGVAHAFAAAGAASGQTIWICTTGGFAPITVPAGTGPLADSGQNDDTESQEGAYPSACPLCTAAKSVAVAPSVDVAFQGPQNIARTAFDEGTGALLQVWQRQRPEARGPPILL